MSVLNQLYDRERYQAYQDILTTYSAQSFCVISFLYFANVMHGRLLEPKIHIRQRDYLHAIEQSDYLLADGIALQVFHGLSKGQRVENLNGTDFIPFFLDQLVKSGRTVHVGLFTLYDPRPAVNKPAEHIDLAKQKFQERFQIPITFSSQLPFLERSSRPFDLDGYQDSLDQLSDDTVRILLLCTGTPAQELWCQQHATFIQNNRLLVFNAGGLIDYISGFEQRAPHRVVKARILEAIWRLCSHPAKNYKKIARMFGIFRYLAYRIKTRLGNLLLKK